MKQDSHMRRKHLLRSLNLFGLDHLDPVILASLADESTLLLIGRHGTAKSELLNRIAAALKLKHRHYNASLIAFDDLLGFPVPNPERTALTYLRTEGDLWDAESVLLDEISRCRPEHQNKLFSIIHERRIQGLLLESLRFRWSAMNPPISLDSLEEDTESYQGSLPLDPALADRFSYIVEIPDFSEFSLEVRRDVLSRGGEIPKGDSGLKGLLEETQTLLVQTSSAEYCWIEDYVNQLVLPLKKAGWPISGRRAIGLKRSIAAVNASCRTLNRDEKLQDAAFLAFKWGLPQRARGTRFQDSKLKAIHKLALKAVGKPKDSPILRIQSESNSVRRIALALETSPNEVSRIEFSQLVTDAYAELAVAERYVLARHLLPVLAVHDRVTAATYELLSEPLEKLHDFIRSDTHQLNIQRERMMHFNEILGKVSEISSGKTWNADQLCNILYTVFAVEKEVIDLDNLVALDELWYSWFRPAEEELVEAA